MPHHPDHRVERRRGLLIALGIGIVAGLALGATRTASEEPGMPRTARELEAFVWSRVEECHSSDGYLRCPDFRRSRMSSRE